tara:strand:- start:222 stop:956 length:735 start_codon:yes stop_codon:yes gene_type:complete
MTSTQIEVSDGRTQITFPGEVVAAGWLPPSAPLTWEDWLATLTFTRRLDTSLAWVLGDLLLYGDGLFGENYAQAVDGLSAGRMNEVMRVARAYAHEERHGGLSFEHHREVAHFPRPERAQLLLAAVDGEQSRDELRAEAHPVADSLGLPRRGPGPVNHIDPPVETQDVKERLLAETRGESDGRIAEIEARLKAATPGPWQRGAGGGYIYVLQCCIGLTRYEANTDLIEHAPDDIAYLLRALKER